jgi:hypothetical protein
MDEAACRFPDGPCGEFPCFAEEWGHCAAEAISRKYLSGDTLVQVVELADCEWLGDEAVRIGRALWFWLVVSNALSTIWS